MREGDADHSDESVFAEKFHAQEYIQTYYPEIENIGELLTITDLMRQNELGHYVIDHFAAKTGIAHELIENVAIFDFYRVVVEHLIELYPQGTMQVLDIGGGPTVYQHIGLSLLAGHITHSEYLETNRREVLSWLREEETGHTWDSYFALAQKIFTSGELLRILDRLERSSDLPTLTHARCVFEVLTSAQVAPFKTLVRRTMGEDVVPGDMFKQDLGIAGSVPYDLVTSNFVAESAAENEEQWRSGMQHMIARIAPGGFFAQTAIKNASWYQVGHERLPAVAVDEDDITAICEEFGCRVLYQKVLEGSNAEAVGYEGMVFTLAQKLA